MLNLLFRQYLYLHTEMLSFLNGINDSGENVTNSDVLFLIHIINLQLKYNKPLTKSDIMNSKVIPHSTKYRTLKRLLLMGFIFKTGETYKFPHEIPPHLKMD